MRKSTALLFVSSVFAAASVPGCSPVKTYCIGGDTAWTCRFPPTDCLNAYDVTVCAGSLAEALFKASDKAIRKYNNLKHTPVSTGCFNNNETSFVDLSISPPLMPQGAPPACDANGTDDACVTCAKASCCADYQSCFADANCTCLVDCLAQGGTVAACTAADGCGGASAVSVSATTCLDAACPAQCVNAGGMAPGMCPPMGTGSSSSSSSASSTGGPTCTPGPTGSGQACISDGDCASCVCDPQTMTCN